MESTVSSSKTETVTQKPYTTTALTQSANVTTGLDNTTSPRQSQNVTTDLDTTVSPGKSQSTADFTTTGKINEVTTTSTSRSKPETSSHLPTSTLSSNTFLSTYESSQKTNPITAVTSTALRDTSESASTETKEMATKVTSVSTSEQVTAVGLPATSEETTASTAEVATKSTQSKVQSTSGGPTTASYRTVSSSATTRHDPSTVTQTGSVQTTSDLTVDGTKYTSSSRTPTTMQSSKYPQSNYTYGTSKEMTDQTTKQISEATEDSTSQAVRLSRHTVPTTSWRQTTYHSSSTTPAVQTTTGMLPTPQRSILPIAVGVPLAVVAVIAIIVVIIVIIGRRRQGKPIQRSSSMDFFDESKGYKSDTLGSQGEKKDQESNGHTVHPQGQQIYFKPSTSLEDLTKEESTEDKNQKAELQNEKEDIPWRDKKGRTPFADVQSRDSLALVLMDGGKYDQQFTPGTFGSEVSTPDIFQQEMNNTQL